jgi:heme/copper-type cytochrome/quinol oxidase subunit 4
MFGSIKVFARMFRLIATLVVILIVVVGALFLLGGRATEQPTRQIEQQVSLANLQ